MLWLTRPLTRYGCSTLVSALEVECPKLDKGALNDRLYT